MNSLDDAIRGLNVVWDKLKENNAFICGKAGIDIDDPVLTSGEDDNAEGEAAENGGEAGAEGAEGGEAAAEAPAEQSADTAAADASAQSVGGEAPADVSAAQDAAPADAAMAAAPAPEEQQAAPEQQVQEAEDGNALSATIRDVIKTPEDAAKMIKALQECTNESHKKRFIKACCGKIKENVEECSQLDECKQNAFVKDYIKSFENGYDELTESESEEMSEADLDEFVDSMDPELTDKVFEDFVEECGMSEDEIREAAGVTLDDEMRIAPQDAHLERTMARIRDAEGSEN